MAQIAQQVHMEPHTLNGLEAQRASRGSIDWSSLPPAALIASTPLAGRRVHGAPTTLKSAARIAAVLSSVAVACILAFAMVETHDHLRMQPSTPGLPAFDRNGDPTPSEILMRRLRELRGKDPAQEFTLHTSVGHLYRDKGFYTVAAEHYAASLELAHNVEDKIAGHRTLGQLKLEQGLLSDARRHLEEALKLHGEAEHPGDASSEASLLRLLANCRRDQGHLEVSWMLYDQAWRSGRSQTPGDGDGDDAADILPLVAADFGDAFARRGRLDDASAWLKEASKKLYANKRLKTQPPGSTDEAQIQTILGGIHHQRGEIAQAIEVYQKALRSQAQWLRATHPDIVGTRLSLAKAIRDRGSLESALQTVEAVEITLRAGPREGPDLSRALILKADLLREAKHFDVAEAVMREALQLQAKAIGGQDHPEVGAALNTYGSILHDSGRLKEALKLYNQAMAINLATVGELHPETAATHNSLGTLFQDVGDMDSARKHFARTLEIQRKTVGERSPEMANTYNNLATVLHQQGSSQEAAELLRKALHVLVTAGVPVTNPDRIIYEQNLAEVLRVPATPTQKGNVGTNTRRATS